MRTQPSPSCRRSPMRAPTWSPKDLDYAKLKARRMRGKRTYLDDKRAKADVFTLWRRLKTLTDLRTRSGARPERARTGTGTGTEVRAKQLQNRGPNCEVEGVSPKKDRQGSQVDDATAFSY